MHVYRLEFTFVLVFVTIGWLVLVRADDHVGSTSGAVLDRPIAGNVPDRLKPPQLFCFERFKILFHKSYGSTIEELSRLRVFLSRAYRVFISKVNFLHRRSSYYQAINDRSDWTPEELEASRNHYLAQEEEDDLQSTSNAEQLKRPKRNADVVTSGTSEDSLADQAEAGKAETGEDQKRNIQPDGAAQARVRTYHQLPVKSNHRRQSVRTILARMFHGEDDALLAELETRRAGSDNKRADDDEVWVDHRKSGCFHPVQHQRDCGSCYAVATLAFIEWAHCNETGNLLKFSDQYIVDCGPKTSKRLAGCNGGDIYEMAKFVNEFGLEMASNYPTTGRDGECPFKPDVDFRSMGHVRLEMNEFVKVDLGLIEHHLTFAPIIVSMRATDSFDWYGGGVFDGKDCLGRANHAALLVGHGREDGEEYWLVRNSYGRTWGEDGHMKLNKNSDCIRPRRGAIYGSKDGLVVRLGLHANE